MERRSTSTKILCGAKDMENADFPNGRLPVQKSIIEAMLYLLRPNRAGKAGRSTKDAARIITYTLIEHWTFCNIHTLSVNAVCTKVETLYTEFMKNVGTRNERRTPMWEDRMKEFNSRVNTLFDISTTNKQRIEVLELTGVKMLDKEIAFLEDQRGARVGYCDQFVDRQWSKTMKRKVAEAEALERARQKQEEEKRRINETVSSDNIEMEVDEVDQTNIDTSADYRVETGGSEEQISSKKRRSQAACAEIEGDLMPSKWKHIRVSERIIRPDFYKAVEKLISKYHCSKAQAIAAVVVVANLMFGRSWKLHDEDAEVIDLNTAPSMKAVRQTGKAVEALTLKCIVEEMMTSDDVVITYHDDGSAKKSVGHFSVQGLTINGVFRALPTLPVASESRKNLVELKKTVLGILSVCGDVPMKDLFEKVQFRMMDSAGHNKGVDEQVAIDLGTDHIPDELLCSTHPCLMFNREMIGVCATIENTIGKDKIHSTLLVDTTSTHDTVVEQFIDVSMRLISHDFDSKPWNKAKDFDKHISPDKSQAVSLRKERFNRLVFAAAVTIHHGEDISSFLDKFEHVTNNLACIVRSLQDVECLQIMILAIAIIGQHLHEGFLSLTYYGTVNYEKLIPAMQQLYVDLTTCNPEDLLDFSRPAFKFISLRRFNSCKWDKNIIASLEQAISVNRTEVIKVLKLMLPQLAIGWHRQRADVFGFGDYDKSSPRLLLSKDISVLNQAPVSNMDGERQVGRINYELSIRGGRELATASSSIVKSQSFDLIETKDLSSFTEFRKLSSKVNTLVEAWKADQENVDDEKLSKKEKDNLNVDVRRNKDLAVLKKVGGPFTSSDEVRKFVDDTDIEESEKINRLKTEVRYNRDTSLSLPRSSDIFRMKRDNKPLPCEEYATNLSIYLEKIQCNTSVTMQDFVDVLEKMISK